MYVAWSTAAEDEWSWLDGSASKSEKAWSGIMESISSQDRKKYGGVMSLITLRKAINPFLHVKPFETLASNLFTKMMGSEEKERRESWGDDYPNQTFYIVRRPNQWGLMSIYVMYLRYFDYAIRRGWIPVVDMETASNLYSKRSTDDGYSATGQPVDNLRGAESIAELPSAQSFQNSWEYFFEQPCGYSLKDVAHAKHVVISGQHILTPDTFQIDWNCINDERLLAKWRSLAKTTIRLSPGARQYVDRAKSTMQRSFCDNKVLGVYCRGTDYTHLKPKGHPVQPTPEMVISKAREMMDRYGYKTIYLVTEDADVLNLFTQEFGAQELLYLDVKRYEPNQKYIWENEEMLGRSRIQNGLEYLSSMKLIAECDSLICGLTGGTTALFLMRDRSYTHQYVYDLGRY